MIRVKIVSAFCLTILALGVLGLNVLPAFGVPGKGTSITIKNEVIGTVPNSVWSYTITELSPPKKSTPYTASFNLPAEGEGTYSFGGLRSGAYRVFETSKFGYITTMTITSNKYDGSQVVGGSEVVVNIESSEGKTVTFTNNAMPAFVLSGLVPPPPNLDYSIPPLKPIPVQAAWDVDINNDGRLDLVLEKSTAILVNLTGPTFLSTDSVKVSVAFEGNVYTRDVTGSDLASNPIVSYYPIAPSITGDKDITGIYQVNLGGPVAMTTTLVTVKDTISLSLYYAPLTKSSYGSPDNPTEMMQKSRDFIDATFPVKSVTATMGQSISGSKSGSRRDPYAGMLKDIQAVAQQAQLNMGGSAIGVAIAPTDYFAYHGFPGAAGVSFGPAVKGVIAVDGYWTVPAHEVAHTFGLYYGVPEEYILPGNPFPASGVQSSAGEWRNGYSFMSVAEYQDTALTWVNSSSTYEYLFTKTRVIQNDPEILLVSGIIYDDGTVEFPLDWIHMQEGIPDTLIAGDYSLNFVSAGGTTTRDPISFGLSFTLQISMPGELPGDSMGGDRIDTDEAGFSFAIPYPPVGTEAIQVLDSEGTVLATYYMEDVKSFGCTASLAGNEGLNDWYVSPVQVTITSIVDPTATPPISIAEIHYKVDEYEITVYGSSAQFDIITDGIHTLEYWGVDNAGNEGRHHIQMVNIDHTDPTLTKVLSGTLGLNEWYTTDVTVTLTGDDSTSGWNRTEYKINGGTLTNYLGPFTLIDDGVYTLYHRDYDNAGNMFELASQTVKVDKTPPTVTLAPDRNTDHNGWYNYAISWTVGASDLMSGVASKTADFSYGGPDSDPASVSASATDQAGNVGFVTANFKYDATAPVITINSPTNTLYTIGGSVVADWSALDSLSGISSASGTVASGLPIDTSTVGPKTFTVTAYDNAGNTATLTINYNVGYAFSGFFTPVPDSQYNIGRTVPVKFELTDSQGNSVTTAVARIYVAHVADDGTIGPYLPGSTKDGTGDNIIRSAGNQYIFNLDTSALSVGKLRIRLDLDDGTSKTVEIILK